MRKKILILIAVIVILVLVGIVFTMTGGMVAKNSNRCVDTDSGLDTYNGGICTEYYYDGRVKKEYKDQCMSSNSTAVREYYCNQKWLFDIPKCQQQTISCSYKCIADDTNLAECIT